MSGERNVLRTTSGFVISEDEQVCCRPHDKIPAEEDEQFSRVCPRIFDMFCSEIVCQCYSTILGMRLGSDACLALKSSSSLELRRISETFRISEFFTDQKPGELCAWVLTMNNNKFKWMDSSELFLGLTMQANTGDDWFH